MQTIEQLFTALALAVASKDQDAAALAVIDMAQSTLTDLRRIADALEHMNEIALSRKD